MTIAIERVLVATDFSRAGQRAVDVAAEWALATRAQLRIVHVTPPTGWSSRALGLKPAMVDSIQRHAADALKRAADQADPKRDLEISTAVLSGPAARSIARAGRDYRAHLIVVGATGEHDESGEQVLGGTSAKLLAAAEAPLLLVRGTRKDPVAGVVAALDLSPRSRAVLEWADLAAAERHLYACHVYEVPFAARFAAYGLSPATIDVYSEQARNRSDADLAALVAAVGRTGITTRVVKRGEPAVLLRRYIESVKPALVVLGKHVARGRSRASRVGNVCLLIASTAACNVLVL